MFTTITAGELRDLLADLDDDAPVAFSSDYGDHHHTEQLHPLSGEIRTVSARRTAYSASGWAVGEEDPEEGPLVHVIL